MIKKALGLILIFIPFFGVMLTMIHFNRSHVEIGVGFALYMLTAACILGGSKWVGEEL